MDKKIKYSINVENRKASYEYNILQEFEAGIILKGSEVKSIRKGGANITSAYCYFDKNQLVIRNMHIASLKNATPHEPIRDRILLLKKKELKKIAVEVKNSGITLIAKSLYNVKGLLKLKICLAQGKKLWDKKHALKERQIDLDAKRQQFE